MKTLLRAIVMTWILVLFFSIAVFAAEKDDNRDSDDDREPVDVGGYITIGSYIGIMDTARLSDKIRGASPFRTYTPDADFELHFFGRKAAIAGFSGGYWANASNGTYMDTTISGWDIQLDLGTPIVETNQGVMSILFGLGYAENYLKFDGDFAAVELSDPDLPDGVGKTTLKQQAFVFDAAIRADFRAPIAPGENGAGLMIYGLSMGYKCQPFSSKWKRDDHQISNVPYIAENMIFARIHVGLGGGAYLHNVDN